MLFIRRVLRGCIVVGILVIGSGNSAASANSETVLYAFKGGNDGSYPSGGVMMDSAGNLYGTTQRGGSDLNKGRGCGTVYKLSPDTAETILHAFSCRPDGQSPSANLVLDNMGNIYGTTLQGGKDRLRCRGGCGTVFKIAADGQESVLYRFLLLIGAGPSDILLDSNDKLYGVTTSGGSYGSGIVYKMTRHGKESTRFSFTGNSDGEWPSGNLISDKYENLYGTTQSGGASGYGVVFMLAADGTETVLYSFKRGSDGGLPLAGLVRDRNGNLYGTTYFGGASCGYNENGCGTVFKLTPGGTETVLHAFSNGNGDGEFPTAGLIIDKEGELYGTTSGGGSGSGTVFKVASNGTESVLYAFTGGTDGGVPLAPLLSDGHGHLLGTTSSGGGGACSGGCGVVFEIDK